MTDVFVGFRPTCWCRCGCALVLRTGGIKQWGHRMKIRLCQSKTPEILSYFLHKITCKRPQCWRILQIFCISCAWSYMPWSTKGAKLALDREEKDINLFRFKLLVSHFKIQPFLYPVKLVNSLQCFLVQFQLSSFMLDGPHQTLWRCSEINLGLTELELKS